ncbi:hypothetical protein [Streptomyces sp. NPDC047315]|uniref:hypothetical protein n=1 Tax=Streptomyces sp. NPDC047315 TaxID=3155142 RepID=UPI0033D8AC67
MRAWYACLGCEADYLPPESMTYPSLPGVVASTVHCSTPGCEERAAKAIERSGLPAAVFQAMAARAAARQREEPAAVARAVRRARGARSASGPRSARSRLS